jgi:GT2 family glycosyltransferase
MYLTPSLIEPISEGIHPNFIIYNYGETKETFKKELIEKQWFVWIQKHKVACAPGGWVMNTNSFLSVGGKDESLFLYGEDVELMIRLFSITKNKYQFIQVGDSILYHFCSKSGKKNWNKIPDDQIDEHEYIRHKHGISIADFEYKVIERGKELSEFRI